MDARVSPVHFRHTRLFEQIFDGMCIARGVDEGIELITRMS